ncbi:hypothetical protein [Vibrio ezurae]|uniref:C-type lysozyme inhibitor domain-containing protein n=1 Tax=Vibrio ezurae NBRC 102218 TaxID=1219080 RepID=U3B3D4_9VIBR|nr:hypothetical protein [Vibrio ezurae]GAD79977.1 hypothetical protein VEZ01S_21_01010 [Vibrio ezurae NBRC 102218]
MKIKLGTIALAFAASSAQSSIVECQNETMYLKIDTIKQTALKYFTEDNRTEHPKVLLVTEDVVTVESQVFEGEMINYAMYDVHSNSLTSIVIDVKTGAPFHVGSVDIQCKIRPSLK